MEFSETDNRIFQQVFDLKKRKEYAKAIELLKELNRKNKNNSVITGLLGTVFYEIGDYVKSKYYFKKTTALNKNSELASLGLYHSLCHIGNELMAIKELNRYIKVNNPVRYKATLLELKRSIKNSSNQQRNQLITRIIEKIKKKSVV